LPRSLQGRVALVTGAGRGIGAAIAKRLAGDGCIVAAADIDTKAANSVVKEIASNGGDAHLMGLDIVDQQGWQDAIQELAANYGALDILVNNAGLVLAKIFEETELDDWRRLMIVNLEGPFLGIRAALPLMIESAKRTPFGGSIINMSSISGIIGTANLAGYTTAKAGLRFLSKCLAIDFGRKGYRIRVNSVHPGSH
jgi:3(or 17)beta-hydroxysteroid dehydrogenase